MTPGPRLLAVVAVALASLVRAVGRAAPGAEGASAAAVSPLGGRRPVPFRYDLRASGRVTPVRDQGATARAGSWRPQGPSSPWSPRGSMPRDFSENNLADHMGSRFFFEGQAPSELAVAYYARWEGPVFETATHTPAPDVTRTFLKSVRHVQEVLFLPQRTRALDNAAVKWAVRTNGGVDAAIDGHRHGERLLEQLDELLLRPGRALTELNHHVLCVGWDDAYPGVNFTHATAGRRRLSHQEQLGHGLRGNERLLLALLLRPELRQGAGRVRRRRGRRQPRRHLPVRRPGPQRLDRAGGGESAWYASRFACAGSGDVTAVSFYTPVRAPPMRCASPARLRASPPRLWRVAGTVPVGGYHTIASNSRWR